MHSAFGLRTPSYCPIAQPGLTPNDILLSLSSQPNSVHFWRRSTEYVL